MGAPRGTGFGPFHAIFDWAPPVVPADPRESGGRAWTGTPSPREDTEYSARVCAGKIGGRRAQNQFHAATRLIASAGLSSSRLPSARFLSSTLPSASPFGPT